MKSQIWSDRLKVATISFELLGCFFFYDTRTVENKDNCNLCKNHVNKLISRLGCAVNSCDCIFPRKRWGPGTRSPVPSVGASVARWAALRPVPQVPPSSRRLAQHGGHFPGKPVSAPWAGPPRASRGLLERAVHHRGRSVPFRGALPAQARRPHLSGAPSPHAQRASLGGHCLSRGLDLGRPKGVGVPRGCGKETGKVLVVSENHPSVFQASGPLISLLSCIVR